METDGTRGRPAAKSVSTDHRCIVLLTSVRAALMAKRNKQSVCPSSRRRQNCHETTSKSPACSQSRAPVARVVLARFFGEHEPPFLGRRPPSTRGAQTRGRPWRMGNWDDRGPCQSKRSDHVVLPVAAKFPPLQTLTSPNLCPSLRGSPVQNFPRPVDQFLVSLLHLHQHHLFVSFFSLLSSACLVVLSLNLFYFVPVSSSRNLARAVVCPFLVRKYYLVHDDPFEFAPPLPSPNLTPWRPQFQSTPTHRSLARDSCLSFPPRGLRHRTLFIARALLLNHAHANLSCLARLQSLVPSLFPQNNPILLSQWVSTLLLLPSTTHRGAMQNHCGLPCPTHDPPSILAPLDVAGRITTQYHWLHRTTTTSSR